MENNEKKETIAAKLIAGLRERLNKKSGGEKAVLDNFGAASLPSPQDVEAIFEEVQDKLNDPQVEMEMLHRFIDEWVEIHNHSDVQEVQEISEV